MNWKNIRLIFHRELRDQLRDRRTLFMMTILPILLYPILGLGLVEMMLTFSEQRRTVVILNADQLPVTPALLDQQGVATQWYEAGEADASRLRVITDGRPADITVTDVQSATIRSESDKAPRDTGDSEQQLPGEKNVEELLHSARQIAAALKQLQALESAEHASVELKSDQSPLTESEESFVSADQSITPQRRSRQIAAAQQEIHRLFAISGIQVLMLVPDHYGQMLNQMQQQIIERSATGTQYLLPDAIQVIRNSADDKSAVAFGRIATALQNWEDAISVESLVCASLPPQLQHPARLQWLELARSEQVSASAWSKLFPTMLVIMALTGAFYPAIDLGAGEKERGTMETLLICPAKRVELVLGKFATVMLFSICTALLNLLSLGVTGQHMATALGGNSETVSLELPSFAALKWLVILLIPLASLFSALCLALATFARSTKEGQYYLTPLLMGVTGVTVFCMAPSVEMTPLYSVLPVINVTLLLKGLLLTSAESTSLIAYAVPVLVTSVGYSMLALWWAIELYNSEDVLFREAEKLDLRLWLRKLLRTKDAVPAFPEAIFCFALILLLQFVAMSWLQADLTTEHAGQEILRLLVIQQLVMIACPAVFMGVLLTTSLRATFRLRRPSLNSLSIGVCLALVAHPLSVELSQFLLSHQIFPPLPEGAAKVMSLLRSDQQPLWLLLVVFGLTPAICEELAFRGFILSGLARGGRLAIAIVISSLMFGIIHMIPQQAFNAALLGLVLGLLAVYSRSLFPAIAFHFVNNAIATLHAGGLRVINADGVFFSRDAESNLRYEAPLLILCGVAGFLMILHMSRFVIREQDRKRRGLIPSYKHEPRRQPKPA